MGAVYSGVEQEYEKDLQAYRKSGDIKFLAQAYSCFQADVFRMCMYYLKHAQDSEDAVVNIFLEIRDKYLKYEIENFPGWLHTLTRNHCLKRIKAKARLWVVDESFLPELVESEYESDHIDRWLSELPEAIDALDTKQRWCIVLFYLHGKSYQEIEQEMGYTNMEVKSAIQNGKIKLRKILESYGD